jgi:hypothetical protein
MRALLGTLVVGLASVFPHTVDAADAVPNESAAIAAVKAIFFASRPVPEVRNGQDWHARLRGDQWQVWFGPDYSAALELPCLPFVYYLNKSDGMNTLRMCLPEPPAPPTLPPPAR